LAGDSTRRERQRGGHGSHGHKQAPARLARTVRELRRNVVPIGIVIAAFAIVVFATAARRHKLHHRARLSITPWK
jgi:hypothetical protein